MDFFNKIFKDLRLKIFLLFSIMGIVPFFILVVAGAYTMVDEQEAVAKETGLLKNNIISDHMTELIEKNQAVLKSLAMSPNVIEYVQRPTEDRREYVTKILRDMNDIFRDENPIALTRADGWQIIRTDGATLVNLKKRQHFQEAIKGRAYVSDIISSMATGKMIIVLAVPVLDLNGKPVGMIQRNFDLSVLQDYVKNFDDRENSIVVMDRRGRIIANSDNVVSVGTEYAMDNRYKEILEKVYNSSGTMMETINGERILVVYSRNVNTGWMLVTLRPYHYIMDKVYEKSAKVFVFGICMILVGTMLAYWFSLRVANPIIEITNVVEKISEGDNSVEKLEVNRDDELGQMAAAFNKLRTERDTFQQESELDRLTGLFNKKTMENICRMKLKAFNDGDATNLAIAFYIIDLDHFKEVNDLLGHQFGDKVLVEFAKNLKKIFRSNDCIGRFGGDEFVIILDGLPNTEFVSRKAEQIKRIAANLTVEGKTGFVTASIGIAIAPQNGRDYDSLFAAADKAVYYVKNHGKNNYYCEVFAKEAD